MNWAANLVVGYLNLWYAGISEEQLISTAQLFLKSSFWSAWQSSSDRRMLTKRMKLILWSFISLNNCYLFLCEGRQNHNNQKLRNFWYFLKWFFCTRKGLAAVRAAPVSCGLSCVSDPPWVTSIASISHIWPRYRRPKFWNNFSIPNQLNEKTSRKQNSLAWHLSIIIIFHNLKNISREVLLNCFMTKSGQIVFSP